MKVASQEVMLEDLMPTPADAPIPALRLRAANDAAQRPAGRYVLYWMIAQRRLGWNFALQHAAQRARALGIPLVVLESLVCDYPWACQRFHRFIIEGMAEHERALASGPITYYPYVEQQPGQVYDLLGQLAAEAALVVTDDFPAFILPAMVQRAAARLDVAVEAVDANGFVPLRLPATEFTTAHAFRRFLHAALLDPTLRGQALSPPLADPLLAPLPARIPLDALRVPAHPPAAASWLAPGALDALPIARSPGPVSSTPGGEGPANERLDVFVESRLGQYVERRLDVDDERTSGLAPYLHFGQISTHAIMARVLESANWSPTALVAGARGNRAGFWGAPPEVEAFLDQVLTWRELGFNTCVWRTDYDQYDSLPPWALATLAKHAGDLRPVTYKFDELDGARTHDAVWNAAQGQLVREGRIHNYLRMLWGKKVLEWSATPQEALATLIELNNRYALDGRDPNSYSGILWCFGRYDRAWGPERAIFGTVRYMTSPQAERKLSLGDYKARYSGLSIAP
jgi:deoxyribodipyrimidine photo-lyase